MGVLENQCNLADDEIESTKRYLRRDLLEFTKMAESADFDNFAQYVNFNVTNLDRDAFIFHKCNFSLAYDGIRLKWNNSFEELQEFFQNTVGLNGKWIKPPSGGFKRYIDADFDLVANWYPGKRNSLLFKARMAVYYVSF